MVSRSQKRQSSDRYCSPTTLSKKIRLNFGLNLFSDKAIITHTEQITHWAHWMQNIADKECNNIELKLLKFFSSHSPREIISFTSHSHAALMLGPRHHQPGRIIEDLDRSEENPSPVNNNNYVISSHAIFL